MREFGIIGNPLKQSFSKKFFNDKFHDEGIDAKYLTFELQNIDEFMDVINQHPNLCGLNVTLPYKEQVIKYLDNLSPEAEAAGAVNVIKIDRTGDKPVLTGYNSDIYGFSESLKPLLKSSHKNALILGTGGASKAVAYVLKDLGIKFTFVSRQKRDNQYCYSELSDKIIQKNTLIINCTPLGMEPKLNDCPYFDYNSCTKNHLLYDLIYNPSETLFLKKGRLNKANTKNGLEMLKLQAVKAWDIWNTESE